MIIGYTRPQLRIREILARIPNVQPRTLHAFVLGPQFDLFRHTAASERAAMSGVLFAQNSDSDLALRQLVPYEGLATNHIVDQAFVKLFGENLEGQYWAANSHVQA